jgi:hypothetical protein
MILARRHAGTLHVHCIDCTSLSTVLAVRVLRGRTSVGLHKYRNLGHGTMQVVTSKAEDKACFLGLHTTTKLAKASHGSQR